MGTLVSSCARFTNRVVAPLGIRVSRTDDSHPSKVEADPDENTVAGALERLNCLDLDIKTIIDVGASNGCWSRKARQVFRDTDVLAFEPLEERWAALDSWQATDRGVHVVKGVAGAAPGMVSLDVTNDLDGSTIKDDSQHGRMVPVATIDSEIDSRKLSGPFLIKLDTHGYEVPILKGAAETLKESRALIIEVYNFRLTNDRLLFHEMCDYLMPCGFRCYDVFDVLRRPTDQAFWQADMLFLKNDHPLFQKNTYR